MFEFIKKFKKSVIAVVLVLAVGGVAIFDTYPTYFQKEFQLSTDECSQAAYLLAASVLVLQNAETSKEQMGPAKMDIKEALDQASRRVKRVVAYIIKHNPNLVSNDAGMVYMYVYQSCIMTEGNVNLKDE